MFNYPITRIHTDAGATSTTAKVVASGSNEDVWVILCVITSVPCQLTIGTFNCFGSAGGSCSAFNGITGAVYLKNPIPIPAGQNVTLTQIGTTTGVYEVVSGKMER